MCIYSYTECLSNLIGDPTNAIGANSRLIVDYLGNFLCSFVGSFVCWYLNCRLQSLSEAKDIGGNSSDSCRR